MDIFKSNKKNRYPHKNLSGGKSRYPYYDKHGKQILKYYLVKYKNKLYVAIRCGKKIPEYDDNGDPINDEHVIYICYEGTMKLTHARPTDVEIICNPLKDYRPVTKEICEEKIYYNTIYGDKYNLYDETFDFDTSGSEDDPDDTDFDPNESSDDDTESEPESNVSSEPECDYDDTDDDTDNSDDEYFRPTKRMTRASRKKSEIDVTNDENLVVTNGKLHVNFFN